MEINYGQEEDTNGAYGSRSLRRHCLDIDDLFIGDKYLDTHDGRVISYGFHSSSGSERHNQHLREHPYMKSEK